MALRNPPTWLQQGSHMAVDDRLMLQSVVPHVGVADIGSMYVRPTATPSMAVEIDRGGAFVRGTQLFNQGMYHCYNESPIEISIAPASQQHPRIDLVVLRVYDAEVSASINECRFEVITGSAAVTPITPPLPVNSIPLATVEVPAGATQISGNNIADERPFARTRSAPEWITSVQAPVEAIAGEQFFETDTGRQRYWNGTALRYPGHRTVATSTLRPNSYTGLEIYESDTRDTRVYAGGTWAPPSFYTTMRHQFAFTGGGAKSVDSFGGIKWSQRFIAISQSEGPHASTNGFFQIDMPPDGTVIPNVSGGSSVTVAGGRIPLGGWAALWYILPTGNINTSVPGNFRVSLYSNPGPFTPGDNWVLVAVINPDSGNPYVKWATGDFSDYWRTLSLVNGWAWYGGEFPIPGYRKVGDTIHLRGLLKHAGPVTGQIMCTLPVGYRPPQLESSFTTQYHIATIANLGIGGIGVHSTGEIQYKVGSGLWFSFDGISFLAEQ